MGKKTVVFTAEETPAEAADTQRQRARNLSLLTAKVFDVLAAYSACPREETELLRELAAEHRAIVADDIEAEEAANAPQELPFEPGSDTQSGI